MYCDGPLLWALGEQPAEAWRRFRPCSPVGLCGPRLLLAGRQPLPGLHPLQQSGFAIADGPADPDVRRAIAAHAGLRQPRSAEPQSVGRLPRSKEDRGDRLRLLGTRNSLIDRASWPFGEGDVFGSARRTLAGTGEISVGAHADLSSMPKRIDVLRREKPQVKRISMVHSRDECTTRGSRLTPTFQ